MATDATIVTMMRVSDDSDIIQRVTMASFLRSISMLAVFQP